jgi:hyperosmotically inducible protein
MFLSMLLALFLFCVLFHRPIPRRCAVKENVEQSLKENGFDNVNVDEDRDKGVITLKGEVKTDEDKTRAQ